MKHKEFMVQRRDLPTTSVSDLQRKGEAEAITTRKVIHLLEEQTKPQGFEP